MDSDARHSRGSHITGRRCRHAISVLLSLIVATAMTTLCAGSEVTSRVKSNRKLVTVRKPGSVRNLLQSAIRIHTNTELRMNCVNANQAGYLAYGAVLDGRCYLGASDFVFIKNRTVDYVEKGKISATNCRPTTRCNSASTVFRCRESDIVCQGVDPKKGCNPHISPVTLLSCQGVTYEANGNGAWLCRQGSVFPGIRNGKANCIYLDAKRKDIENWVDFLIFATLDHLRAVFAAAYAVEGKEMVPIPEKISKC